MERHKNCSFFGHREIEINQQIKDRLTNVIENLILSKEVSAFLFGSRSDFNYLAHLVVTELKDKYTHIRRIAYTCKSESCILEKERREWEEICSELKNREVRLLGVEEECEHKTKYTAGRASYVERNQAMIDDSDYCIFYYDENYRPQTKPISKLARYSTRKSGTALAYKYANKRKKVVINLFTQ